MRTRTVSIVVALGIGCLSLGFGVGMRLASSLRRDSTPRLTVDFVPDDSIRSCRCDAPYYGMGDGDGVLDPVCADLQLRLTSAAAEGDLSEMTRLLRIGASPNSHAGSQLPLYSAAQAGQTEAVRMLIDNGAFIDHTQPLLGTALMGAVTGCHVDTVRLLLANNASANIGVGNDTPLSIARERGHYRIVLLLLTARALE